MRNYVAATSNDHLGLLRIPGPSLTNLAVRFSLLANHPDFNPASWPNLPFSQSATFPGWWELDLDLLGLVDGIYEYEFVASTAANANFIVADPYTEELTRFGGYRGLFTIVGSRRQRRSFDCTGEFQAGTVLPANKRRANCGTPHYCNSENLF